MTDLGPDGDGKPDVDDRPSFQLVEHECVRFCHLERNLFWTLIVLFVVIAMLLLALLWKFCKRTNYPILIGSNASISLMNAVG